MLPDFLIYLAVASIAVVAMVPGWMPMMIAGFWFGPVYGSVLGLVAMSAGATGAFWVGRTVARNWVERRIAGNRQLQAIDAALEDQAFFVVMLTRVALVIPFNVLNYAYGLTRVRPIAYTAGTTVGVLPIVVLYAWLGSLAANVDQILEGDVNTFPGGWWTVGIALVAIAIVVTIIRRAMQKALDKRINA